MIRRPAERFNVGDEIQLYWTGYQGVPQTLAYQWAKVIKVNKGTVECYPLNGYFKVLKINPQRFGCDWRVSTCEIDWKHVKDIEEYEGRQKALREARRARCVSYQVCVP